MNIEKSLEEQIRYIWSNIKGFHIIHFIYTGNELELFSFIDSAGKDGISIEKIASSKSLNLSYLSKWCMSGIAWGILDDIDGKVKLASQMKYLLTRPGDPRYLLPYIKSCIDHFGPDMKNHAKYFLSGKKYLFQDHGKNFSDDIGSITEGLQTLMANKILPELNIIDKKLKNNANFLDFGCGTAKLLLKVSTKYPSSNFYGMDIDASGIKIGRRNIKQLNKEDIITLIDSNHDNPPSDESMDIVTMVEVLHEIDKKIRQNVLKNIAKLTKKDGYIVILDETMPNINELKDDKYSLSILTQYNEMTWGNEVPSEQEQNDLLLNAGFSIPERKIIGELFTLLVAKKI